MRTIEELNKKMNDLHDQRGLLLDKQVETNSPHKLAYYEQKINSINEQIDQLVWVLNE